MSLYRWSKAEDDILRRYCNRGVDYCRKEISKRCGKVRTANAIRMRGSRIGVSFERYAIAECANCHREFHRTIPTNGLCRECSAKETRERLRARKERIERNVRDVSGEEVERVRRENAALRKWCSVHK